MYLLLISLISFSCFGKTFDTYGARPFLSLSKSLSAKGVLTFYHADTFSFSDRTFNNKHYRNRNQQAYFQTAYNYKIFPHLNIAGGHIYQRNNPLDVDFTNEHRIFEQAVLSHAYDALVMTHRIRFEQRFIDERHSHEFKTRLRYQIGAKIPLQGRNIDPKEWYFNCYNEFYFSTTGERNAFFSDDWAYLGLGYQTVDWGKLEFGPLAQYAVVNRDKDFRSFYVLQFGWILNFK